jgi:hypothetical protein
LRQAAVSIVTLIVSQTIIATLATMGILRERFVPESPGPSRRNSTGELTRWGDCETFLRFQKQTRLVRRQKPPPETATFILEPLQGAAARNQLDD